MGILVKDYKISGMSVTLILLLHNDHRLENKDKNHIQLRVEFLNKYGKKLYPNVKQFVVAGLGLKNDITENYSDNS